MTRPKVDAPWRSYKGLRPHALTLRSWRIRARALAKSKGFHTSCDLCKRPIARDKRFGRVGLRNPLAWRSPAKTRIICHSCYLILGTLIEDLEINGARDHLPPEDYADVDAETLAAIDSGELTLKKRKGRHALL